MLTLEIYLIKPAKNEIITFPAALMHYSAFERVVQATWQRERLDLGYVVFDPGDTLIEYYYTNRWYTIFAIYGRAESSHLEQDSRYPGSRRDQMNRMAVPPWAVQPLKGWYCNVARPAIFDAASITSEDLELDLFVSSDYQTVLTLDRDEFAARDFAQTEPATSHAALAALAELEQMARERTMPQIEL